MSRKQPTILILTGPTASGKSSLALRLVNEFPKLEILNADSLLVYRDANIGAAKPTHQELQQTPHHLINICGPEETFTAGDFYRKSQETINDALNRKAQILIVGGTGFYLKALIHGLWEAPPTDPKIRAELEVHSTQDLFQRLEKLKPDIIQNIMPSDRYRIIRALEMATLAPGSLESLGKKFQSPADPRFEVAILERDDQELQARIEARTQKMLQEGLIAEVDQIRSKTPHSKILSAVGYQQVCQYLDGTKPEGRKPKPGIDGLKEEINLATRQLVKRQRTWFKSQTQGISYKLDRDLGSLMERAHQIYG